MNHYIATFDNNGTEYFRTHESNASKVKNFAIRSSALNLRIWKKLPITDKEQKAHLTDFRVITEQEFIAANPNFL